MWVEGEREKKNDFIWIYKNRANQVTYCHRQNGTTRQEEGKKRCIYRQDWLFGSYNAGIMYTCVWGGERCCTICTSNPPNKRTIFSSFSSVLAAHREKRGRHCWVGRIAARRRMTNTHVGQKKIPRTVSCFTVDWKGEWKEKKKSSNLFWIGERLSASETSSIESRVGVSD